jgi:hypothetical protein
MAQAVSHRSLTAEARVQSQVVDKIALRQIFLRVFLFVQVHIIPPTLIFLFIYVLSLPDSQKGEAQEPSKKQCSFGNQWEWDRKAIFLFFLSLIKT